MGPNKWVNTCSEHPRQQTPATQPPTHLPFDRLEASSPTAFRAFSVFFSGIGIRATEEPGARAATHGNLELLGEELLPRLGSLPRDHWQRRNTFRDRVRNNIL